MRPIRRPGVALAVVCAVSLWSGHRADAETVYGLTSGNSLITFDSANPGTVGAPLAITGLTAGDALQDIDVRPQDLRLYALASSGRLYAINRTTGAATLVSTLSSALTGTRFGIDFNPTVDRLRIVSNTGQNLRVNVDTGATTVDTPLNGAVTGAASAAYTNSDLDPGTGTALFYLAAGSPAGLFTTSNPNGGVTTSVGSTGVNANQFIGFDVSGVTGVAFASFTPAAGGPASLYTVNLTTGAATLSGLIGPGPTGFAINGIAALAVPAPGAACMAGLACLAGVRRRR